MVCTRARSKSMSSTFSQTCGASHAMSMSLSRSVYFWQCQSSHIAPSLPFWLYLALFSCCTRYWGYTTTCGTEGNQLGILYGREKLPEGILYCSKDTHYSVPKAAHMYDKMTRLTIPKSNAAVFLVSQHDRCCPRLLPKGIASHWCWSSQPRQGRWTMRTFERN